MKKLLSAFLGLALLGLASPAFATVNAQTGTTYTFVNTDCDPTLRTVVTFSNAAAVAVTLPQAGASGNFAACTIKVVNLGVGIVTITPTTSTINGTSTLVVPSKSSAVISNDSTGLSTGNYMAELGNSSFYSHLISAGPTTAPALTSCGTTPAIAGTDTAGTVTMGTGTPTGCVITFNVPYTGTPNCVVTWIATPLASQSYAVSATAITLTQTATSSNKVNYMCMAPAGG